MNRSRARGTSVDRIAELPDPRVEALLGDESVSALTIGQCLLVEKQLTNVRATYRTMSSTSSRRLHRSEVDGLQRSWAGLVHTFSDACRAYAAMCRTEDYGDAWEWLERLAACWRRTGEDPRLEGALGWDAAVSEHAELFAALETGLILATSTDPPTNQMRPTPGEIAARTVLLMDATARRAGDRRLRRMARSLEHELGVRVRRPRHAGGPYWLRSRARRAEERRIAGLLSTDLIRGSIDAYRSFDDPGEHPSLEQSHGARESVANIAVNERAFDMQRYVLSAGSWEFVQPFVALIHSLRRSLVLRMSDDPENRTIAMPFGELQWRVSFVNERVHSRSHAQAWDALRASIETESTDDGPTETSSKT